MKKLNLLVLSMIISVFFWSCTGGEKATSEDTGSDESTEVKGQASIADDESAKNIVQIAAGSPDHTTLVAAVKAAGLVDVLANNGPLTVFAPTNAAFDELPEGTLEELLKPENKSKLVGIIYYHAAPGTYKGDLLPQIEKMGQATGEKVKIEEVDGEYTVNGAKILATIDASNGVVHVIDKVLLPPE